MIAMSTIEEVAFLAKVSVATVSRVINDKGNVSQSTKERVEQAVKALKYQPNAMGVLLRKERTEMVLVLLHSVDNPFFSSIVQGIEKVAHENNYNVLISTTYGDHLREDRYIKMLKHHFVDGVILITNTFKQTDIIELSERYPVAQVLEYVEGSETTHFSVDFYGAAHALMEHLIQQGKKNIYFAHTGLIDIVSTQEKYKAYLDTLKKHQLPCLTHTIKPYDFGFESGRKIALDALLEHPEIDAFMASSDLIAAGIMDVLKEKNIPVPESVAVVGFDNTIFSQLVNPKLTTVDVNGFKMGEASMKYILDRLANPSQTQQDSILFETHILKRHSS